jgi:hypothetical protein
MEKIPLICHGSHFLFKFIEFIVHKLFEIFYLADGTSKMKSDRLIRALLCFFSVYVQ